MSEKFLIRLLFLLLDNLIRILIQQFYGHLCIDKLFLFIHIELEFYCKRWWAMSPFNVILKSDCATGVAFEILLAVTLKYPTHFEFAEVSEMSSRLTSESRIYADKARDLNRQVSFLSLLCFDYVISRDCFLW